MHRDRADGIVDLEAPFDPVMHLVDDHHNDRCDQQCLDRMIEVVASGAGNDSRQTAGIRPVGVAFGHDIAGHQAATQRHDEVEGDGRERRWLQIDIGRRPEHAVTRLHVVERDVAGRVKPPETGVDQEQADTHQPRILRRDIARRAVCPELSDARAQVDELSASSIGKVPA